MNKETCIPGTQKQPRIFRKVKYPEKRHFKQPGWTASSFLILYSNHFLCLFENEAMIIPLKTVRKQIQNELECINIGHPIPQNCACSQMHRNTGMKFLLHGCRIVMGRSKEHCCPPISTAQYTSSAPGMLELWLCSCWHS